jgi:hypothetical protein
MCTFAVSAARACAGFSPHRAGYLCSVFEHEMDERNHRDLVGEPSDYGSRTLEQPDADPRAGDEEQPDDTGGTADGEPREDRGTADSAISRDAAET